MTSIGESLARIAARVEFFGPTLSIPNLSMNERGGGETITKRVVGKARKSTFLRVAGLSYKMAIEERRIQRAVTPIERGAVIVADDRRVSPDLIAVSVARRRGLASVVAPFAISSPEANLFMRQRSNVAVKGPRTSRQIETLIERAWPGQVLQSPHGERSLFYSAWDTVAIAAFGLLPKNPWVMGGSGVDLVCALGGDHRDYLLAGGISEKNIAVTGQPSTDQLALPPERVDRLRSEYTKRYGFVDRRPIAVCAVPQFAEHGIVSWQQHSSVISRLFSALSEAPVSVLLSLHPRSDRASYIDAARRFGLAIAEERIIDLLPVADIFVATYSSTVRWAVGLGIPAFVVDPIGLNYTLYDKLPGVSIFKSLSQLTVSLKEFSGEQMYRHSLEAAAQRGASCVGRIDGQAGERFSSAVQEVIERKYECGQFGKSS